MFSILQSDLMNPFEPVGEDLQKELDESTTRVLCEINSVDLLIDPDQLVTVSITVDEDCVLSGALWIDAMLTKIHLTGKIEWHIIEGATILTGDKVCTIYGKAKEIIGKEKIILDFLSLYSSITTLVSSYSMQLSDTATLLYFNYINLPGFLLSQEYAVHVGGGYNYNSLSDGVSFISRHYVQLAGSLPNVFQQALDNYSVNYIKVEVVSLQELVEVIKLGVKQVRLYKFTSEQIATALDLVKEDVILEVYIDTNFGNIKQISQKGVARIIIDGFGEELPIIGYSLSYINT